MTTCDFTHYALDSGYLYIYKTPDSANYTIGVIGTRKPEEISESAGSDASNLSLDADLLWGLVYSVLEKVAEINNDPVQANRYRLLKEQEKNTWKKRAQQKKFKLDRIQPHSFRTY